MRRLLFLAALPLLLAHLAIADDHAFAVGSCKPNLTSFPTIQAAVNGVPRGSTVLVCPGVYSEQVTILQPLNLQGIQNANLDQIVITVPGTGLPTTVASAFGVTVAPQVLVQTQGEVNITNISVDGTGGNQACSTSKTWLVGIFYGAGSYGEVDRVKTSNQIDQNCGAGIWAENSGGGNESMAIQGSSVHDVDAIGIFIASATNPSPSVTVRGNFVSLTAPIAIGIFANGVNGNLTDNDVSNAIVGFYDAAPGAEFVDNIVTATQTGVFLVTPGTIQSNRITSTSAVAIELSCNPASVSNNNINDANVGLSDVPSGFNGTNRFSNTGTISTNCPALAFVAASAVQGAAAQSSPSLFFQRRSPANPLGLP